MSAQITRGQIKQSRRFDLLKVTQVDIDILETMSVALPSCCPSHLCRICWLSSCLVITLHDLIRQVIPIFHGAVHSRSQFWKSVSNFFIADGSPVAVTWGSRDARLSVQ